MCGPTYRLRRIEWNFSADISVRGAYPSRKKGNFDTSSGKSYVPVSTPGGGNNRSLLDQLQYMHPDYAPVRFSYVLSARHAKHLFAYVHFFAGNFSRRNPSLQDDR